MASGGRRGVAAAQGRWAHHADEIWSQAAFVLVRSPLAAQTAQCQYLSNNPFWDISN